MEKIGTFLSALIWVLLIQAAGWSMQDAAVAPKRHQQIVVLKNGQSIAGDVEHVQQQYRIRVRSGSVIVLRDTQVSFVADSLAAAYWEKSARTKSSDVAGQIAILQWCIRNDLLSEAANHLLVLQDMDIGAAKLAALDQGLRLAENRAARQQARQQRLALEAKQQALRNAADVQRKQRIADLVGETSVAIPNLHQTEFPGAQPHRPRLNANLNNVSDRSLANRALESNPPRVIDADGREVIQQVTYLESAAGQPIIDAQLSQRKISPPKLDSRQQERAVAALPKGAVGVFKLRIEPLLGRSCSSCHGRVNADTDWVFRWQNGAPLLRSQSQQNLHALLQQADRSSPAASELWKKTVTAHGGMEHPIFKPGNPDLDELKQWLIMISDDPFQSPDQFDGLKTAVNPSIGRRVPVTPQKAELKASDPFDGNLFNQRFGD